MTRPKMLHIAPGLAMPLDAVTETFWFLGKRGSGKTHNASVFVEELLKARLQVVVIDPMHAWWGLRSSIDGKSAGMAIAIFGGPRGDIPLEQEAGAYMADLAIRERISMILDIKGWAKAAQQRFVAAFLRRMLAHNDEPVMTVIEEAPIFAPMKPSTDDSREVGNAVEEFGRLGRGSGCGLAAVSQRSATLHSEVRAQMEVLVAHRVRSPLDVGAVREWFDLHDPDRSKVAAASLPHLETGTALISSTDFLHHFGPVTFRPRETFDSSATPKVGQKLREARTFADLPLDDIKAQMAATIEKAKAEDPRELRRQIAELRRDIARMEAAKPAPAPPPEPTIERIDVPVLDEKLLIRLEEALVPAAGLLAEVQERLEWEVTQNGKVIEFERRLGDRRPHIPGTRPTSRDLGAVGERPPVRGPAVVDVVAAAPARRASQRDDPPGRRDGGGATVPRPAQDAGGSLPAGERRVLKAAAQSSDGATRTQLTILSGFKRSTRDAYIQRLRQRDYVAIIGDRVHATTAGIEALGDDYEPLPTGAALRHHWLATLPDGEARILSELIDAYPNGVHREQLSELTGYKRSTRDAYLQRLRARELVTTDGEPCATRALFD